VHVRAVLRYSPEPKPLQITSFVEAYLKCGRHADALHWLDGHWQHQEQTRLRLLAEAYAERHQRDECAAIRKRPFDAMATVHDFRQRDILPAESHSAARAHAHQVAAAQADPITAANLLHELGDAGAAEAVLVSGFARIEGNDYFRLVPLAEALEAQQRPTGASACYRALLLATLARAYARAYGHAANYLGKLRRLARELPQQHGLESHESFEAALRAKQGRKTAFWSRVAAG
jgi:hypothetical protein